MCPAHMWLGTLAGPVLPEPIMRVIMCVPRVVQDAGWERPLDVGQSYELADGIAAALIATGAAVRWQEPAETREMAVVTVPNRKGRRERAA